MTNGTIETRAIEALRAMCLRTGYRMGNDLDRDVATLLADFARSEIKRSGSGNALVITE